MNSIDSRASFFGWLTIVNIGIYLFVILGTTVFRSMMLGMNTKLFGISEVEIMRESFRYVAHYKLLITIFCFAPYLSLKIMV